MQYNNSAIVIGAGIVGLATARALAIRGFKVTVIERNEKPTGASIRNFGMIWPIGQPDGYLYNRAIRSKSIWKEIAQDTNFFHSETGSLHLAYHADEWLVLQELYDTFKLEGRPVALLDKNACKEKYRHINLNGLQGALLSETETIVDPREAMLKITSYLQEKYGVNFIWGKTITYTASNKIWLNHETMFADVICICSGADFETLYPEFYYKQAITKCKLQMLRFSNQDQNIRFEPALCGGLSLMHYQSFKSAPSITLLRKRYDDEMAEYLKWGIHVMVSQNGHGELTVGDSHEYGLHPEPFDRSFINEMIMNYLNTFAITSNWKLIETWHGIYPKMTNGDASIFAEPDKGVYILNGLGGAGMTLSFGFAEEIISTI